MITLKQNTAEWIRIKQHRLHLLQISDRTILNYMTKGLPVPDRWRNYRKALRDVPNVYKTGDLNDFTKVKWPAELFASDQRLLYSDLKLELDLPSYSYYLKANKLKQYYALFTTKWLQLKNYEQGIQDSELDDYIQSLESLTLEDLDKDLMVWPNSKYRDQSFSLQKLTPAQRMF